MLTFPKEISVGIFYIGCSFAGYPFFFVAFYLDNRIKSRTFARRYRIPTMPQSVQYTEKVSVIMPTYNESQLLVESIRSILSQTYTNIELLITDDASPNAEVRNRLLQLQQEDSRVRLFFLDTNYGPGLARNISIEKAEGRYIAFCDSDDCWTPDKVERQVAFMQKKGCALSYTSYLRRDPEGKIVGVVNAPKKLTLRNLRHDNKIGCSTAMYDTKPYGKFFMPTLRKRQDWALFLTIMKKCGVAYGLQEPLTYYCIRPGSVSKGRASLVKYNAAVYQQILGYSKLHSYLYLFFIFMPHYLLKKLKIRIDSLRYKRPS